MRVYYFREELKGVKRSNNAKDIDWSKVANSVNLELITKPPPMKINVNEILYKMKPAQTQSTAIQTTVFKNGW